MGLGKWISGAIGFMAFGPLGALAGYALGSLFESNGNKAESVAPNVGQRNGFLFSLLVMASYIIRADGKVMHSEMETVRRFLRSNFGERAVEEGNEILLKLFEERKRMDQTDPYAFRRLIYECGEQIKANLNLESRLLLLNFLVVIAQSDGSVCEAEIAALREVAQSMGLSDKEIDSMLNLRGNRLEDAYKVLEIEPTATDSEVKNAYRRLSLKHHPDKVSDLGEDMIKAAQEKFQKINEAKEIVYAARGMK